MRLLGTLGVLAASWSPSSARSRSSCPSVTFATTPTTHGLLTFPCLHRRASPMAELELPLSLSLLLSFLSLSCSLDVFFPSRHRNSLCLDSLRGFSTTVWSMRFLVVF